MKTQLLERKAVQCFKCWGFGHVRSNCKSDRNRIGNCFKCGGAERMTIDCRNEARCMPCRDIGKDSNHRMGGNYCEAMRSVKRKNRSMDHKDTAN